MSWNPEEDNSESEEEIDDLSGIGGREAVIFLVDAFLYEEIDRFKDCLEILKDALVNGLLTRDKDLIGVVFYNTEHSPEPKDIAGIQNVVVPANNAVLLPLRQLSKDIVTYYLNFATPDYFDFRNKYGTAEGSFSKAIWLCTNMFKLCGFKLSNSSIIAFTDRDNPHPTNSGEFQKAIQKAKDLEETGINFTLLPMSDDFSYEPFYKEFMCTVRDMELDEFIVPDLNEERKMIKNRQARQDKRKCNVHIKWTLGEDLQLSVGLYNYFKRNVYPKSVTLLRVDNSVIDVKRVNKVGILDIETNEIVNERYCKPGDERKTITVGGQKITFTSDELAKMRSPLAPGLTLLGFKPSSCVSIHNFVKSCSFLYPDEKTIAGSTKLFRALWEKCLEKQLVAFCVLVTRRKSAPHYVALVPTEANYNEATAMQNDGFQIVYLPFDIDCRDIDLKEFIVPEITNAEVELFQKILKKLRIKYRPTMFSDPHLEELLANIAAMALDIQTESAGSSGVDVEKQTELIQPIVDQIKLIYGQDPETGPKRRADNDGETQRTKLPKITDEHLTKELVEQLIGTNTLDQLNVKQLRSYLQDNNVKGISSAKKSTLIDKVMELHS